MNILLTNTFSTAKITDANGIKEKDTWNHYIKESTEFDFYHTYDYHLMDHGGDPFIFVYQEGSRFLSLPFIKRKIEQTPYFDCTSVYGYTGALTNIDRTNFVDDGFIDRFSDALKKFLLKENIICCFSVLHPLFDQKAIFKSIKDGQLLDVGQTVAINLQTSLEEQRSKYRRPIRMKVSQLRRKGYEVHRADSELQLREFITIYRENMIKVGASEKYFFEDEYFERFMHATDYQTELLLACYENKIVAGAMVVLTNDIMQLHLAGTRSEFFSESPMKLIFDEATLLGRARDARLLHLGSGVGGKADSLFHFKIGFSDNLFDFTTWQFIANETIYNELVQNKIERGLTPNPLYFPLYRSC